MTQQGGGEDYPKRRARFKHRKRFRVSFSDVDMAGIVYTARYSDFILKGWEDYFSDIGIPWESYVGKKGFGGLPVIKMSMEFKSPARCGDWLTIETAVSRMTLRRIYFKFKIFNEKTERQIIVASITVTAFNSGLKPVPIPSFISRAIISGSSS